MSNSNQIFINKHDFTKDEDKRMHAIANLKNIYFTEDQYRSLILEFQINEVFGYRIPEIESLYICRFPSPEYAKIRAPYSYTRLLESVTQLQEDANGNVNLSAMINREFLITIQKKVDLRHDHTFFNLLNLVYIGDEEKNLEEGGQQ